MITTPHHFDHPLDKVYEAVGSPADWPHPHWFRCPNGHLGMIARDQYEGEAQIVCKHCGWAGYRK